MSVESFSTIYFGLFLFALLVVAVWSARKKRAGNTDQVTEQFLGGKSTPMFMLAMSYCAGSVSAGSFVGDPAIMSTTGWPYYWGVVFMVPGVVIPAFFVIRKLRLQCEKYGSLTLNEYYSTRFKSPFLRLYLGGLMTVCMTLVLVAQFKGAAVLLELFTGIPFKVGLIVMAVLVMFYVNMGGLRSVAWTDTLQGCVMVVASLMLVIMGIRHVGGFNNLEQSLYEIKPSMIALVEPPGSENMPIWGIFGYIIYAFTVFFALPYTSSRYLAMKEVSKKTVGKFLLITLFSGAIFNLMFMNGLVGRVMLPDAEADYISVMVAKTLLPPAIAGICMIGFFAAIISTATSVLLVVGQCAGRDVWGYFDKKPGTEKRQIRVSQITNVVAILIVIIFNMVNPPEFLQLFIFIGMTGVGCACTCPIYFGPLWKHCRREGIIAGSIAGPFSYLLMQLGVINVCWAWAMGLCVIIAVVTTVVISVVLNKVKGYDEELVAIATVKASDIYPKEA